MFYLCSERGWIAPSTTPPCSLDFKPDYNRGVGSIFCREYLYSYVYGLAIYRYGQ